MDKLNIKQTPLNERLKDGVIMDVVTVEQAKIAEAAGAVAVMALEKVPADIRREGGVARMSDPALIRKIIEAVDIPVMAKVRIGHSAEASIVEVVGADYIDESEVLTSADPFAHIDKHAFDTPFVCGAKDLGEALRRIDEGAAMIRTKGEAGTGDISEAVRHVRTINRQIEEVQALDVDALTSYAQALDAPRRLIEYVHEQGALPVLNFAAGGVATPADAVLMVRHGCDGVFVGSGIFKSETPERRARAIVEAVKQADDPAALASLSEGLGASMAGEASEPDSE